MEISFKLEKFEGPLDLLLRLIEKNKIDIFDIPIETITDQYLDYVRQMGTEDLDVLSDFLVMAATLLDIKSRMLLPPEESEEDEEEGDPREELVRRLLEYKMYRYLSRELLLCEEKAAPRVFRKPSIPKPVARYVPPVNLDEMLKGLTAEELGDLYRQLLRRRASRIDPVRSGAVMRFARRQRHFTFRQAVREGGKSDRIHVVVAFLAMLELMKVGKIRLTQDKLFDDMEIETIEPEGAAEEVNLEEMDDFADE